jgi:2-polyprenyl-3-methyl-5-hydroxy-6-metoxy-1,4-benzoquinol methylase
MQNAVRLMKESESVSTSWEANNSGEYLYGDAGQNRSHSYLLPALTKAVRSLPSGIVVMDFGCGNGALLAAFKDRGWDLHGMDFSTTGIAHAQAAYPFIKFTTGDVAAEQFYHPLIGKCDLVVSTEVVEHVYLPRRFASNCFSLLKPGGILIISTPYHGYLKNVCLALSAKLDQHFHALWDYGHIKFWSRKTLTHLLEEAKFHNVEFFGSGRLPYLWKSMLLRCTKPQ